MLAAWRLAKTRFVNQAFDGEGAYLFGGRWNSRGTRMVYTAQSIALAVLEILAHIKEVGVLSAYSQCAAHFDESLVAALDVSDLPTNWRDYPAPRELQLIGDDWITGRSSLVLKVPSVLVTSESNYLINPLHPDFASMKVGKPEPFDFDPRLLGG